MKEFDTQPVMTLSSQGPGTYSQGIAVQGNSVLSSLFIESMDPGATIKVNYWDTTTGEDDGERYDLKGHPLFTAPQSLITNRQTIGGIHNKLNLEVVITGGEVTFGIYLSVVGAFATDADAALVLEGQTQTPEDRGTPTAVLDPATGVWHFASGVNGVQNVSIDNAISTNDLIVTEVHPGSTADLQYTDTVDLLSFSPSAQVKVPKIIVGGTSYGLFKLIINGSDWGTVRTSYQERQLAFEIGTVILQAGDTLKITVTNESVAHEPADFFGYIYTGT